jgi:DNA-binding NtrC family response regulator
MSLIEEARALREKVAARLAELEPLVREYNELKQAAAELGIERPQRGARSVADSEPEPRDTPPAARPARRPARRRSTAGAARPARAAGGELEEQVLAGILASPGGTVADYSEQLGMSPTRLYGPVKKLTTDGRIVKRGHQLFPADRPDAA